MEIRRILAGILCPEVIQDLSKCSIELKDKEEDVATFSTALSKCQETRQSAVDQVIKKSKEDMYQIKSQLANTKAAFGLYVAKGGLTPVDEWCRAQGYKEVKKVYEDKIIIGNVKMPCSLIEIFTPNSHVIQRARKKLKEVTDRHKWYKKVTNLVNQKVKWTDDGRYDNYYYPNYTLTTGEGDCDDHAFLQMSLEPEMGNAFGFYKRYTGHSFGVGIVNGDLWVFDAVGNEIQKYIHKKNKKFYIHYIITKNAVYQLDGSAEFGKILWE